MQVAVPPQKPFIARKSKARRSTAGADYPHNYEAESGYSHGDNGIMYAMEPYLEPAQGLSKDSSEGPLTDALDPNDVDVHELFKEKMARSSEKLEHFFGVPAPHDICIKEIRKEGLKAILESKVPLCYFLRHLMEEFSCENLFFFIELQQYEELQRTSPSLVQRAAENINSIYLNANSHFEVNVDDKVRRRVEVAIEEKNTKMCFRDAKRAIYTLLEPSFVAFQSTKHFQSMVENCGELTTCYDPEAREKAVAVLQAHLEKQQREFDSMQIEGTNYRTMSRKRHDLTCIMVKEFCHTIVGCDIILPNTSPAS